MYVCVKFMHRIMRLEVCTHFCVKLCVWGKLCEIKGVCMYARRTMRIQVCADLQSV